MEYDLELKNAIKEIRKAKATKVCIQLPDGLKPKAGEISKEIEKATGVEVLIWGGSCFGACDVPVQVEKLGVDMLISWGHSQWEF